jgi:hypothetical protein
MEKKHNQFIKVVIILIISTLILVALMYLMQLTVKQPEKNTLLNIGERLNIIELDNFTMSSKIETDTITRDGFISDEENPNCFKSTSNEKTFCLSDNILIDFKEKNELIASRILNRPDKQEIIYFRTEFIDWNNRYNINRVYAYNIKNNNYKIIYKELIEEDEAKHNFPKNLYLNAISGSKLIFIFSHADFSPGPCFENWANARSAKEKIAEIENGFLYFGLSSLELSEVEEGLKSYDAPATEILDAKLREEKCLEEMWN